MSGQPFYCAVLTCHPAAPCHVVQSVSACLQSAPGGELTVDCSLRGDLGRLRLPSPAPPRRVDGLWAHTCFEIFVGLRDQSAYYEFNLSPSGEWAAYAFQGYRASAALDAPPTAPKIYARQTEDTLALAATLRLRELPLIASHTPLMLGLAAVIEDATGALSYWALKHAPGRPDFHHADAFALTLPAIETWLSL